MAKLSVRQAGLLLILGVLPLCVIPADAQVAVGIGESVSIGPINATVDVSLSIGSPVVSTAIGLNKVNHVIIVIQENHSFDNYFGVLANAPGSPYHAPSTTGCAATDNTCVDGLSCTRISGNYTCTNSNLDDDGSTVFAFHDTNYCPAPDLDHGWASSHKEANFSAPNTALLSSPNDGFARVNDATEQKDNGVENATEDDTMGFYNENDLAYYYALAQTFAIDDRYFCDVIGPTVPNRMYAMAATSFGHLTTSEVIPPNGGYKPITGTILDLLDSANVSWVDYFTDLPSAGEFRTPAGPHFQPAAKFFVDAATGMLPAVSFVDPELLGGIPVSAASSMLNDPQNNLATDEHPPHDIRSGQFWVAQVVNAVRNSPNWQDSIIFLTYDEHGGFYDHVAPAPAPEHVASAVALNPDGVNPGQCEDLSNPPTSTSPGGGANCNTSATKDAPALCPGFTPTGSYPTGCANFDQLGFRVPFIAVSPFSKQHYVSHTVGDHTSILALLEKRFLNNAHLTLRDAATNDLEDLFDFDNPPSLNANVSPALAPIPNLVTDGNGSCTQQQPPLASMAPLP